MVKCAAAARRRRRRRPPQIDSTHERHTVDDYHSTLPPPLSLSGCCVWQSVYNVSSRGSVLSLFLSPRRVNILHTVSLLSLPPERRGRRQRQSLRGPRQDPPPTFDALASLALLLLSCAVYYVWRLRRFNIGKVSSLSPFRLFKGWGGLQSKGRPEDAFHLAWDVVGLV